MNIGAKKKRKKEKINPKNPKLNPNTLKLYSGLNPAFALPQSGPT